MCDYLITVRPEVVRPSLILLANFEAHMTPKNIQFIEEELSSVVCTLPPNMASILQSLDVGVMGQFKDKLTNLRLQETRHPSSPVVKRMACTNALARLGNVFPQKNDKEGFRQGHTEEIWLTFIILIK